MVIFIYGPDNFRSGKKVGELKKRFLEKNPTGSGLSVIEFEKNSKENRLIEIEKVFGLQGLFFSKQLIIVKNLLINSSASQNQEILDFLRSQKKLLDDQERVLLFFEEGSPKEKDKLFQYLEKNAKKQEFATLTGAKLEEWIKKELQKINPKLGISREALETLILYVGGDSFQLENEIQKLANFKSEGEISTQDVVTLVKAKAEANIFETVEALGEGNKKQALALFHKQLEKGEDPFYILSMYIYQFRNLLKIGEFFYSGIRNEYEIAKVTSLHPFVVKKGIRQLQKTNLEKLKSVYQQLAVLDGKLKIGELTPELAIDKFIVES